MSSQQNVSAQWSTNENETESPLGTSRMDTGSDASVNLQYTSQSKNNQVISETKHHSQGPFLFIHWTHCTQIGTNSGDFAHVMPG